MLVSLLLDFIASALVCSPRGVTLEDTDGVIGASAASPVLARSMPTLFVCMSSTDLYVCHRPTGRIAHAQEHAKHML